ncbi:MAG: FISUMP domain-containing protein, partial [Ignavibacteriota bacterium]
CYSGWQVTTPGGNPAVGTTFISKNPLSYYSYSFDDKKSTKVSNRFSIAMEDTITTSFFVDRDSTGIVHLANGSRPLFDSFIMPHPSGKLYCNQNGPIDYSYQQCGDSITDVRDGQKYATACIGKQIWMAQNLNYNAPGSISYDGDPANEKRYGRLYDFNTLMQGVAATSATPSGVQGVCPKGWHVPSMGEYQQLTTFLGGAANAGGAMKSASPLWTSPNSGATNSSGFSALPGGYMVKDANGKPSYNFLNTHAYFWSASLGAPNYFQIYVLTNTESAIAAPGATDKFSLSCRCLKD